MHSVLRKLQSKVKILKSPRSTGIDLISEYGSEYSGGVGGGLGGGFDILSQSEGIYGQLLEAEEGTTLQMLHCMAHSLETNLEDTYF